MVIIELTDQEADLFIALRKAKVFEMKKTDILLHFNEDGILTDIKKPLILNKKMLVDIYRRGGLDKGFC